MLNFHYSQTSNTLNCIFGKSLDANVSDGISSEIKQKIDRLIASDKHSDNLKIIFDFKNTDYISSLFLRTVVTTAHQIKKGDFIITNANQYIQDLFKTSGLDKFIQINRTTEQIKKYYPSKNFSNNALIKNIDEYKNLYEHSLKEPENFWNNMAKENLSWHKEFDKVCEWKEPYSKWFEGGKLNASYNCLDRHLNTIPDKTAIIWEGEPDSLNTPAEIRKITYRELHKNVCRFANVLKNRGAVKGDRVIIYMPMIPEAVTAMLACARLGLIHSVVFAGFSAQAIAERTADCQAKMIITADGTYRRGSILNLKKSVDDALNLEDDNGELIAKSVNNVIIHKHTSNAVNIVHGRDLWLHEELREVDSYCEPELVDSEDKLFVLYTSGSTGKPKGIVHSTAGYLLNAKLTHKYIFDIKDSDIFWCTADIGWITGHSYVVYGPLANGATIFMYEGAPDFPNPGRFWKMIEKHSITILYTAPTAIRSFMKWGDNWPENYDLSSLRLLGSVGEPINPQAWLWYNKYIGNENCPIVDTWWQTETGTIMISSIPGAIPTKPGSATLPFFGIKPEVINEHGEKQSPNSIGSFIIKHPWPSMLRGLWNDSDRYVKTYWQDNPGSYTTGDSARYDDDGYFWIIGREDDVINVSGHRIGTAEVENVLVSHDIIAEAAAIGIPDDIKGSLLVVFVTLMPGYEVKKPKKTAKKLKEYVTLKMGSVMKPHEIRFTEALPKTRSGKIMRRLLKQVAAGTAITGDLTTLEDFNVLAKLSR
ncbi:MAG: acetate--CoA ligase [bacterium]|nr:acetate--CoA ligase [bacterium]